jgi:FMN reductase
VLHAVGASDILPGVYATDAQVHWLPEGGHTLVPELASRLFSAVEALQAAALPPSGSFAPVAFVDIRVAS